MQMVVSLQLESIALARKVSLIRDCFQSNSACEAIQHLVDNRQSHQPPPQLTATALSHHKKRRRSQCRLSNREDRPRLASTAVFWRAAGWHLLQLRARLVTITLVVTIPTIITRGRRKLVMVARSLSGNSLTPSIKYATIAHTTDHQNRLISSI